MIPRRLALALGCLLAFPFFARAEDAPVAHLSARLEELCQQMEALGGDLKTKEAQDAAAKLEEAFEKAASFRAADKAWPDRVKACRAWWENSRRRIVDADVPRAIDAGVALLKRRQQPDGGWKFCQCGNTDWKNADITLGTTALAVYTLLKCGVRPDDKSVAAGLDYLIKAPPMTRISNHATYTTAIIAMALSEALEVHKAAKWDPKLEARERAFAPAARSRIAECALWLTRAQLKAHRDGLEVGRWHYERVSEAWCNSNTQYALLGLLAARNAGTAVSYETWQTSLNHWRVTQLKDGGWSYMVDKVAAPAVVSTPSMTLAGMSSVLIGKAMTLRMDTRKAAEKEKAIESSKAWIEKNYPIGKPAHKPDNHAAFWWGYYTLYALERAMTLAGFDELGGRDWYHDGALHILFDQRPEGHWVDTPDTCFALLFLKRAVVRVMLTEAARPPAAAKPPEPPASVPSPAPALAPPLPAPAPGSAAPAAPPPPSPPAAPASAPSAAAPQANEARPAAPAAPAPAQPPEKRGPGDGPGSPGEEVEVSALLGPTPQTRGLVLVPYEDGPYEAATREGRPCVKTLRNKFVPEQHLYFDVADNLPWKSQAVDMVIEYFDGAGGQFRVQYDSTDAGATLEGVFKSTEKEPLSGTNAWKTKTFRVPDPAFRNRQQGRFDFRIETDAAELCVSRVALVRCAPASPPAPAPKGGDSSAVAPAGSNAEASPAGAAPK